MVFIHNVVMFDIINDFCYVMQVPVHQHILTEVHLFATAGFRILAPRPAADLINSCRTFLAASRFKFRDEWASVMSGTLTAQQAEF